jgi:hypothetical protein
LADICDQGREYSGDTDSGEEEEDKEDEKDEEDEEDEEESGQVEKKMTEEEVLAILRIAAEPSGRLGPLPGTIGAEVYGSDTDDSDYVPDSTASDPGDHQIAKKDRNDPEMNDIE